MATIPTVPLTNSHDSEKKSSTGKYARLCVPEDHGKFVAIDVVTGDYETDEDDYTAVMRLRSRVPTADIWLMRAGFKTTYRIRAAR